MAVCVLAPWREPDVVSKLPPPLLGITDLKFNEFFVLPIGPLGLEPTEKLLSLDGKRVRLLGYMVRQEQAPVASFLFTAIPMQIHEHDNALADDLPPAIVRVKVPTCQDKPVPFVRDLLALTGTLHLGNSAEADGRATFVRMDLDPPKRPFFRTLFSARVDQGAENHLVRNTVRSATP